MSLVIYNTYSQKKETFKPLKKNKVTMYVCGPTVYNTIHVGNARPLVFFDVVYRYLKFKGYDVTYVRNITDIDDKIIKKALEEKKDSKEISETYIKVFHEDCQKLSLLEPTHSPKATEHISEMIQWIEMLIKKKYAYAVNGEVLFSIEKFKNYGKLSKKNTEELISGARVEVSPHKKNPIDFVLWKPSKEGEPSWKSPWGKGRPGWHLECSVMSTKYLGNSFDIHGGGRDLIFPHHENEIAQSEACTSKPFVHYWMHNEMLVFGKQKMSKSLGNIVMVRDVLNKYPAEVIKYLLLSNHYRSPLEFSEKTLKESVLALERIYKTLQKVKGQLQTNPNGAGDADLGPPVRSRGGLGKGPRQDPHRQELDVHVSELWKKIEKSMDDDFNTTQALGEIFEAVREMNRYLDPRLRGDDKVEWEPNDKKRLEDFLKTFQKISSIWGIFEQEPELFLEQLKTKFLDQKEISPEEIEKWIKEREDARQKKDWKKADDIRKSLEEKNIILEDTPTKTLWKVKT